MKTSVSAQPAPKKPARPAAPYHHGNLREALLTAADTVLTERGAHGITLREVAKAAGVSHAAPYHHFSSLNDLLAAVAEREFMALAAVLERAAASGSAREKFLAIADAYVRFARSRPAQYRLMFGPLMAHKQDYPGMRQAGERAFGVVLAAANAHDPKNGPELALCGWSLAHGLSNLMIDGAIDNLSNRVQNPDRLPRRLTSWLLAAKGI
jgi:AcrR family transcriptional regulator